MLETPPVLPLAASRCRRSSTSRRKTSASSRLILWPASFSRRLMVACADAFSLESLTISSLARLSSARSRSTSSWVGPSRSLPRAFWGSGLGGMSDRRSAAGGGTDFATGAGGGGGGALASRSVGAAGGTPGRSAGSSSSPMRRSKASPMNSSISSSALMTGAAGGATVGGRGGGGAVGARGAGAGAATGGRGAISVSSSSSSSSIASSIMIASSDGSLPCRSRSETRRRMCWSSSPSAMGLWT